MNCFKVFAKTISFLLYIFEIYVQLFLRNAFKFFQILLIEWNIEWQRITTSDNEYLQQVTKMTMSGATNDRKWQRVTANYSEWQQMTISDSEWQQEKEAILK